MLRSLLSTVLIATAACAVQAGQVALKDEPLNAMAAWSWTDCGLPSDPIQIESISVSPDPPKPGQDLTVIVKGEAVEQIEEGAYADVVVKMGLIKILTKRFDACEEARGANATIQCPVEKGKYTVEQTVALPREIPPGKFNVAIFGYTVDDDDMLCLTLNVDFTPGRSKFW